MQTDFETQPFYNAPGDLHVEIDNVLWKNTTLYKITFFPENMFSNKNWKKLKFFGGIPLNSIVKLHPGSKSCIKNLNENCQTGYGNIRAEMIKYGNIDLHVKIQQILKVPSKSTTVLKLE